jgi:hypothetical protein
LKTENLQNQPEIRYHPQTKNHVMYVSSQRE